MVVAALDGARYSGLAAVEMLMEKPRSSLDSAAMVADALALLVSRLLVAEPARGPECLPSRNIAGSMAS